MLYSVLVYLHVVVALLLAFVVVMQKTTGNGLFTTSQSNPFMSGSDVDKLVTKITSVLIFVFFVNTLFIARISAIESKKNQNIVSEVKAENTQIPIE